MIERLNAIAIAEGVVITVAAAAIIGLFVFGRQYLKSRNRIVWFPLADISWSYDLGDSQRSAYGDASAFFVRNKSRDLIKNVSLVFNRRPTLFKFKNDRDYEEREQSSGFTIKLSAIQPKEDFEIEIQNHQKIAATLASVNADGLEAEKRYSSKAVFYNQIVFPEWVTPIWWLVQGMFIIAGISLLSSVVLPWLGVEVPKE